MDNTVDENDFVKFLLEKGTITTETAFKWACGDITFEELVNSTKVPNTDEDS
jgi:hypothetical protein